MTRYRLALILVVLSVRPLAAQETVRGVVYDPHGRTVSGADVAVTCGGPVSHAVTTQDGLFSVGTESSPVQCDVTVLRHGFDPWRRAVRPLAEPIIVTLAIAPVRETASVKARSGDIAGRASSSLTSVRMDAAALSPLGMDSRAWLDVALNAAGAFVGARRIDVDGMPADAAPQAARIAAVVVNADPFSAEFGGVDQNRIQIEMKAPDRRWRFNADGPALMRGGGDPLAPRVSPRSRRRNGGVSGPVPRLPLTFFVQGGTYSSTSYPTFLAAQDAAGVDSVQASSRISSWSIGTTFTRTGFSWDVAAEGSDMDLTNAAVGELTAPSAGIHSGTLTRRLQSSWKAARGGSTHRGGVLVARNSSESVANSTAQARTVFGQVNTSGSDTLSSRDGATRWFARHIMEGTASARPWSAGVEISRTTVFDARVPNPLGHLQLEATDATHGTLIAERGTAAVAAADTTAAAFVQSTLLVRSRVILRAGVRGDWQAGGGLLASPRTTALMHARGFLIATGAGLFVEPWSSSFVMEIARRSGRDLQTFVVPHVPATAGQVAGMPAGDPLILRIAPGLARRRDVVLQTSVRRRMRALDAGLEYKWTRGIALSGSTRMRTFTALADVIDSQRRLARQQLHARASFSLKPLSMTGHYEFVDSRDDTDGAFSFPARQNDVGDEWGRSTGLPGHHVSIVASFALPGAVRCFVSGTASSQSPYTIVTGRDAEGLAIFTDRGGAPRNSAAGPSYRNVSVYASKRVTVPQTGGTAVDVGVRVDNVFGSTNITSVGRVAGTNWLGLPLAASSGRSINVWMAVAR